MVTSVDFWYAITLLGEPEFWLFLSGFFVVLYLVLRISRKNSLLWFRRLLFLLIPSLLLTMLVVFSLKEIVPIERPCIPCMQDITECNPFCTDDHSFPSGHSAIIFAVVTSVVLTMRRKEYLALYAIAALVALSRLALGVHTYVDVYFGALLGLVIPVAVWSAMRRRLHPLRSRERK